MISTAIQQLVNYGLDTGLILPDDEIYIRNQLLMTMQLDDFKTNLEKILGAGRCHVLSIRPEGGAVL